MKHLAAAASFVLAVGCGGADTLDDQDHVRAWVNSGSAVGVWLNGHEPLAFADGATSFRDPACPTTSDDGATVVIEGGCTDDEGRRYVGRATVTRRGDDRDLDLDGYGSFDDPDLRSAVSGAFSVTRLEPDLHAFDVDVVRRGGVTTRIEYAGRVRGGWSGRTVWNGSGRLRREGFPPVGTVAVATADEVLDGDVCSGQPVSGQTQIEAGGHVAVVTYDGETDCDDDQAARWTYDGDDRGLVTGITCHASPGHARAGAVPFALALIGAGLLRRRRRLAR